MRDEASDAQVRASDPAGSVWLSANAGSGKTRVLTERVARLLLQGVLPQRILCLTYTKAAATEMQNRLFGTLGQWAMQPEQKLRDNLQKLGVERGLDASLIARARQLFARAIETPGGLKIQTIHSFCAALLRRFPVEAGVSPGFQEMDDRAQKLLRGDILEEIADGPDQGALDGIAGYLGEDALTKLTAEITKHRAAFQDRADWAQICAAFGIPEDLDTGNLLAMAFDGSEPALAHEVAVAAAPTSKSYKDFAARLKALNLSTPDLSVLHALYKEFLYQSGEHLHASKSVNFPQSNHTKVVEAFAPVADELHAFMDRVAAAKQAELALAAARRSHALHRFAAVFLAHYEAHKSRRGLLDFDDLILKTRDLLTDPAVAQWVLFRLDGGIDHILVDEAQDTSPEQWDVIEKLAQEFTAGVGARENVARTIFVVGDKKQSIYSFQGADPDGFDRMRDLFSDRMAQAEQPMLGMELHHSFRSADPVLRLVDATFQGAPHGLGDDPDHIAFKDQMPGRVDLWPVVEKTEAKEPGDWFDPVDRVAENDHMVVLARIIAQEIRAMVGTAVIPDDGEMRPVREGDFLILVQRRSELFHELIRACKSEGLNIAGADRLKVGGELAVKDITAVLSFLATPEDDLALASALRSPLFGWSETELHALAQPRPPKSFLWTALRKSGAPGLDILTDLRAQADYLRPYDLIERLLTRHDGRRNLLARLGHEAEDGIDALLTLALQYEQTDVPSLTGFLTWLASDEVDIKRQMDSGQNQIRVMTVHGAKGLESPIVILPDTAPRKNQIEPELLDTPHGLLWKTSVPDMPDLLKDARDAQRAKREAENDRLLYVAMTRVEKWLIVAGAGDMGKDGAGWNNRISDGMDRAGAVDHDFATGCGGKRLEYGDWAQAPTADDATPPRPAVKVPGWAQHPVPAVHEPAKPLSPSDLGGAKALPGEDGLDEDAAKARGTALHMLLEHLPQHPRDQWPTLAKYLAPDQHADLLPEARGVLDAPELAPLFADNTLSEVSLTADLPGLGRVTGTIDRLILTDETVVAVDFKSNRIVPGTMHETPEGLLRQMGAYAAMLEQIYPDRRVGTAILWTVEPRLVSFPNAFVCSALTRIAPP